MSSLLTGINGLIADIRRTTDLKSFSIDVNIEKSQATYRAVFKLPFDEVQSHHFWRWAEAFKIEGIDVRHTSEGIDFSFPVNL